VLGRFEVTGHIILGFKRLSLDFANMFLRLNSRGTVLDAVGGFVTDKGSNSDRHCRGLIPHSSTKTESNSIG
jgi:hypothetical protein